MKIDVFIKPGFDKAIIADMIAKMDGVESSIPTTVSKTRIKVVANEDIIPLLESIEGVNSVEPEHIIHAFTIDNNYANIKRSVFDQPTDFSRWFALRDLPEGETNPYIANWRDFPQDNALYKVNSERTGSKIIAIVVDTGIDTAHPEINAANYESIYDAGGGIGEHGTFCASIICGTNIGLVPNARLVNCAIFNSGGSGSSSDKYDGYEAILAFIRDPVTNNIADDDIILVNCSFGVYTTTQDAIIDEMLEEGIFIFAAAGNEAANLDSTAIQPASHLKWGAVAATDLSGRMGFFSGYNGNTKLFGWGYQHIAALAGTSNYVYPTGTSMATPHVLGTFATWISGRYRPKNKTEVNNLLEEWATQWCWTDGIHEDRGKVFTTTNYTARGSYADFSVQYLLATELETIIKYGTQENVVNVDDLSIIIKYDISGL